MTFQSGQRRLSKDIVYEGRANKYRQGMRKGGPGVGPTLNHSAHIISLRCIAQPEKKGKHDGEGWINQEYLGLIRISIAAEFNMIRIPNRNCYYWGIQGYHNILLPRSFFTIWLGPMWYNYGAKAKRGFQEIAESSSRDSHRRSYSHCLELAVS